VVTVPEALAVRNLQKRYGSVHALRGVDLTVEEGQLVGLLGPNGAGKSTLVKIAAGLVRQSGGDARVAGARAGSRPARAALGYLAELFRFPGWYTADEVLELHQRLAGSRGGAAERARLLELVALADARDRRVDGMSRGWRSGSGSRSRSSASRGSSCSTSRRRRSTRSAAVPSACCSRSCAGAACRSSSTATS
jgi:ABC-2 type transport system ATP-binding protein